MSAAKERQATRPERKRNQREPLTVRDERILLLLGEYGCVTAERIKTRFWNDNPKSRLHYRRLAILKRRNLIENVNGDGHVMIGYRLTKKGKEFVAARFGGQAANPVRRSYKSQFEHDQLLIDLREILEKSPLVADFRTESEVRYELLNGASKLLHWERQPTIPDAAFVFKAPGQSMRVAVELELTPKVKRRYRRIFRNHLLSKDWQLVLYIVKDRALQERLMKLLADIKERDVEVRVQKNVNGIYFCPLPEFLSLGLRVLFTNGKREISLSALATQFGLSA